MSNNETEYCAVHKSLEQQGNLTLTLGNGCVACSLNERVELLDLLATWMPGHTDSVTALQGLLSRSAKAEAVAEYLKQFVEYPGAANTPTFEAGFNVGFPAGYNAAVEVDKVTREANREAK